MSINSPPLLSAESLQIQCGEGKDQKTILNGNLACRFSLQTGQFYYLAGASGTGKSTLLWTLARLHPLKAGILKLNGKLSTDLTVTRWRSEMALLPQKTVIFSGSVADNLLYPFTHFQIQQKRLQERQESLPSSEQLQQELNSLGLDDIPLEREATSLSGGQQTRLALIRVLLTKPQILLADEPIAGLDPVATDLVFNRLTQFCQTGGAIMLTSHVYGEQIMDSTQLVLDGQGGVQYQTKES